MHVLSVCSDASVSPTAFFARWLRSDSRTSCGVATMVRHIKVSSGIWSNNVLIASPCGSRRSGARCRAACAAGR